MLIRSPRLASEARLGRALGLSEGEIRELADTAAGFYEPFTINTKAKCRLIDCPVEPLKTIQKRIERAFLRDLPYPAHLHGGIRKRSPRTNATVHLGQSCVVRIDVRSYFPSIKNQHVYELWHGLLGCSPGISRWLTQLTTWRGRLPQGASTSMSLANLVLLPADQDVLKLAGEHDLRYTRYVDDLILSGRDPRPLIQQVVQILKRAGFGVSREKIEIMNRRDQQEVTGHTVNRKDRVTKGGTYRDKIRAAIFELSSFAGRPDLFEISLGSIRGRLAHLRTMNPESASTLEGKLNALLKDYSPNTKTMKRRKGGPRGVSLAQWRRGRSS